MKPRDARSKFLLIALALAGGFGEARAD